MRQLKVVIYSNYDSFHMSVPDESYDWKSDERLAWFLRSPMVRSYGIIRAYLFVNDRETNENRIIKYLEI